MTSNGLTRGPLPASVYWRRRAIVIGVALLLVIGIARLLGGGSDASDGSAPGARGGATLADAARSGLEDAGGPSGSPDRSPDSSPSGSPTTGASSRPTLAAPSGVCRDEDVLVSPQVPRPEAGRQVTIRLVLRTKTAEACTWSPSSRHVTVKITSGADDIWSTRECPKALPGGSVVVRRAVDTAVAVRWNARRSDETCSRFTEYAMPGYYHVAAAALSGEPSDVQFELGTPSPVTITRTASPTAKPTSKSSAKSTAKPTARTSRKPSARASR